MEVNLFPSYVFCNNPLYFAGSGLYDKAMFSRNDSNNLFGYNESHKCTNIMLINLTRSLCILHMAQIQDQMAKPALEDILEGNLS